AGVAQNLVAGGVDPLGVLGGAMIHPNNHVTFGRAGCVDRQRLKALVERDQRTGRGEADARESPAGQASRPDESNTPARALPVPTSTPIKAVLMAVQVRAFCPRWQQRGPGSPTAQVRGRRSYTSGDVRWSKPRSPPHGRSLHPRGRWMQWYKHTILPRWSLSSTRRKARPIRPSTGSISTRRKSYRRIPIAPWRRRSQARSRGLWRSGRSATRFGQQFSLGAAIASESFPFVARARTRSSVMKKISAKAFDARFEAGEDIDAFVDWTKTRRPGRETRRVDVDFPGWIVEALDREAERLGVTRDALIKLWIAERLDSAAPPSPVRERGQR